MRLRENTPVASAASNDVEEGDQAKPVGSADALPKLKVKSPKAKNGSDDDVMDVD